VWYSRIHKLDFNLNTHINISVRRINLSELFTFTNLYHAYRSCLKGKVNKLSAIKFEKQLETNLLNMSKQLKSRTYIPWPFSCFAVTDPKLREVWAADFRDRILHHLLISRIEPRWEKIFISDSYACRTSKGAHRAIAMIKKVISNNPNVYFLHVDVKGFFTNIDRNILFSILTKRMKNPDLLYLTRLIVFHDPRTNYIIKGDAKILRHVPKHKSLFGAPNHVGLPIGNYTSQFFANVYLNELDQYAKRAMKCHYYFRYMDDIVVLHDNREFLLKAINKFDSFLRNKLHLELHPQKTILKKAKDGLNALGYITHPEYTFSRRRVVGNIKMKLKRINMALLDAKNTEQTETIVRRALCVINSYWGHFKYANCGNLKKTLYEKHFEKLKEFIQKSDTGEHYVINKSVFPPKKNA
jgi:RNA-directed DNA polymerase